jgi:hypothetical protein
MMGSLLSSFSVASCEWVGQLEQQEWVSHIEPPPSDRSQAAHVVSYLTRYLTGGPISDHRILSTDDREVNGVQTCTTTITTRSRQE